MTTTSSPVKGNLFTELLPQAILDVTDKSRSNLFAWRGQFSPQLVESVLTTYCPEGATILDPFCGSGTVLYEAARLGLPVYGFELNPAAWILSRVYEFINTTKQHREIAINSLWERVTGAGLSPDLFSHASSDHMALEELAQRISSILTTSTSCERAFLEAVVILLDVYDKDISTKLIYNYFHKLSHLVMSLPYSDTPVITQLADARCLPIRNECIDFVITSPPYINVFNYHQNYRRSAEILGWDLLSIARSEIGSNRANRGNRFFTVIQYCLDMASMLKELRRVCNNTARVIVVIGCESNVLGVPFYNADLLERLARETNTFLPIQRQRRQFVNRFGKLIREDLLHLLPKSDRLDQVEIETVARRIAEEALTDALYIVPDKNRADLTQAIGRLDKIVGTPLYEL